MLVKYTKVELIWKTCNWSCDIEENHDKIVDFQLFFFVKDIYKKNVPQILVAWFGMSFEGEMTTNDLHTDNKKTSMLCDQNTTPKIPVLWQKIELNGVIMEQFLYFGYGSYRKTRVPK